MKRILLLVFVSLIISMLTVSLVGCADIASDFPLNNIENGYYNYMAGGNVASVDGSLYLNLMTDSLYMGTYKVNSMGRTLLFNEKINIDYTVNAPRIYQIDDDIYFTDSEYSRLSLFDCENDLLTDEELEVNIGLGVCYVSSDLNVCIDSYEQPLLVKYKDNDEIKLDVPASAFAIYDNKIYFISSDGYLYMNDPAKIKAESEFVSELNSNGVLTKMLVCNGYCYFTDSGSDASQGKDGLYRYSFDNDKVELVLQQEVLSMNVQGNKAFFATAKGIYVDDSEGCKKLCGDKADEIYVFDDEWIYLYIKEPCKVIRFSTSSAQKQVIG